MAGAVALLATLVLASCTGERPAGQPQGREGSAGEAAEERAPGGTTLDPFAFEDLDGALLRWEGDPRSLEVRGSVRTPEALFIHVFQPDCGKCEELARNLEGLARGSPSVEAVAIAHRRQEQEARAFVVRTGITYPVALGTGSDWARRWARGDPLYVADRGGRIVYRQTGFRADDVPRWQAVAADLAAGHDVRFSGAFRENLEVGDPLPRIELPDLLTGRPMALSMREGRLELVGAGGQATRHRASLGFFSRY